MTDNAVRVHVPTRLDRAVTWTGIGAATALATMLLIGSFWGFMNSSPLGLLLLTLSLAVSLFAGWRLARNGRNDLKFLLRVIPFAASLAWLGLVWAALPLLTRSLDQYAHIAPFVILLIPLSAIPVGVGLLVAFIVLVTVRASRKGTDAESRSPQDVGRGSRPAGNARTAESDAVSSRSTRLDRAVTWTGAGAATACAALLMMYGAQSFAASEPNAENVGEEGIAVALGIFGWISGLLIAVVAGWALAHRVGRNKPLMRALPLIGGIAWVVLARAATYGQWFERTVSDAFGRFDSLPTTLSLQLWPLFVRSVYSVGALPIAVVLLVAFLVLSIVRALRWRSEPVRDTLR